MSTLAATPASVTARRIGVADRWISYAAGATVVGLAGIAGALSYSHMRQLAQDHGQAGWHAHAIPMSVDGIDIMASLVLPADRRAGRRSGGLPWTALAAGTAGSLAANIATAHPDPVSRLIAGWPALALLLAVKLLALILEHRDAPDSRKTAAPALALPAIGPDHADPGVAALTSQAPDGTGDPAISQPQPSGPASGTAEPPGPANLPPAATGLLRAARLADRRGW